MVLDYSKFDHLEDSDDDKPDPEQAKLASRADEMQRLAEEAQKRVAVVKESVVSSETPAPAHHRDRFAYSDGAECDKVAHELLKICMRRTQTVTVAKGVLSVVDVEKIEGDAMMVKVRGEPRHTFDLQFRLRFCYQWMNANFDDGPGRAEGAIAISDFTDATTLVGGATPPIVKKWWVDKGGLDDARAKEVGAALGGKVWPPEPGSLLAHVADVLTTFVQELPAHTAAAFQKARESREGAAKVAEEERSGTAAA